MCTVSLVFLFAFSVRPALRCIPRISIQKEDVRAVKAPSALGNKAEISPIINIIAVMGGIYFNAIVGNKSSEATVILFFNANKYNNPPINKKRKLTRQISCCSKIRKIKNSPSRS